MGLAASQARFLQLTARKSDLEYEVQQISQERLALAEELNQASTKYNDATSNRTLLFSYNTGDGVKSVNISYGNYKSYMNQQLDGLTTAHEKFYLVTSSGKIVVANEEDKKTIMEEDGFSDKDFVISDGLDDVEMFQESLRNGDFYFATYKADDEGNKSFKMYSLEALGNGAISDEYYKDDDAQAEAEYKYLSDKIELADKKLQLRLDQLESERDALATEMESVDKVIGNNVEKTFNALS